jgi:hypothetical protein
VHGLLRAKIESGMGTIPVANKERIQTWDSILIGERLRVMSCSDKLCKYNVTGIQGNKQRNSFKILINMINNVTHILKALY